MKSHLFCVQFVVSSVSSSRVFSQHKSLDNCILRGFVVFGPVLRDLSKWRRRRRRRRSQSAPSDQIVWDRNKKRLINAPHFAITKPLAICPPTAIFTQPNGSCTTQNHRCAHSLKSALKCLPFTFVHRRRRRRSRGMFDAELSPGATNIRK